MSMFGFYISLKQKSLVLIKGTPVKQGNSYDVNLLVSLIQEYIMLCSTLFTTI